MMKNTFKIIFIPFLFFSALELGVRQWGLIERLWISGLEKSIQSKEKLDVIFIGSSRVAASIDNDYFEKYSPFKNSYNLGTGFSTLHEHFFALKKLYKKYPEKLKGVRVFLEAPNGLPILETWQNSWFKIEQPQYLINVMNWSHYPDFLKSDIELEKKLMITFRLLFRSSYLITYKERLRDGLLSKGNNLFLKIWRQLGLLKEVKKRTTDLSTAGGIRNDQDGVKRVRENALIAAQNNIKNQKIVSNWDDLIITSLISLVKEMQGELVLFNMPLSSPQAKEYQTSIQLKNRESFKRKFILSKEVKYLDILTNYSDSDFPDLWHLALSKQKDFTQKIIDQL